MHLAAKKCIDECEGSIEDLSSYGQEVMSLYGAISSQVIVAGMGEVIGLNHLALHEYLRMCEYKGSYYRCLFEAVNQVHSFEWQEIRKHKEKR